MRLSEANYVDVAEKSIIELKTLKDKKGKSIKLLSTSQIRNLLAMTADIYNDVLNLREEKLPEEIVGRVNYLKIRFLYEAGREPAVKNFVEKTGILDHINEIGDNKNQYILFSRYMEALVAYRKYYGGKDE